MYQANIQPVAYVVWVSSRPWALSRLVEQLHELVVGEGRVVDVLDVLDEV